MRMVMDLQAEYDDGYFDKDEQGWCARRVHVSTEGPRVTIRRSGDDNGIRAYDETFAGTIGTQWPELGLVKIVNERGTLFYFDRRTGRLRSLGEQISHPFMPPADYREPGCLAVGLTLLTPVAAALGMRCGPPPTDVVMPALTPSPTASGCLESQVKLQGEHGCTWEFTLRDIPGDDGLGPQLGVTVHGDGCWISLFVQSPQRASFMFSGLIELHHLAAAARDQALAGWCEAVTSAGRSA